MLWDHPGMPNGKPGDHPLTDILTHRIEVFGPRIDGLIREIANLSDERELDQLGEHLIRIDPRYSSEPDLARSLAALESELVRLRDQLRQRGRDAGWEVDDSNR
jgi:hypothetical protein